MSKKERSIELGMTLKELRKSNGLSQQQVADAIGVERSKYAYYENSTRPDYETLVKLAVLYGKTVDEMLKNNVNNDSYEIASPPPEYQSLWSADDKLVELSSFEQNVLLQVRLMNFKEKEKLRDFLENQI